MHESVQQQIQEVILLTFRRRPRLLAKFLQFEASLAADLMMFINEKNVCQFMANIGGND